MKQTLNLVNKKNSSLDYELFFFSDHQPHIKIKRPPKVVHEVDITISIDSPAAIVIFHQALDILNRWGVSHFTVLITYFLGARMDRPLSIEEPFTAKIIGNLLNNELVDAYQIFDAHSRVASDHLTGFSYVREFHLHENFIKSVINDIVKKEVSKESLVLISPDEGAKNKVLSLGANFKLPVLSALKARDPHTGQILSSTLEKGDLTGMNCLIVDDICDGGATFVALHDLLKAQGADKIFLAVSHGIFSKGLIPLQGFTQVYTTNSVCKRQTGENLTVIELF